MSLPGKILFLGLGGAGQRHMRIMSELLPQGTQLLAYRSTSATPLLNQDFSVNPGANLQEKYSLQLKGSLGEAFAEEPDLVVISNPTACHRESLFEALSHQCDIFVEKPWGVSLDGFQQFRQKVRDSGRKFHISFQRRFHPHMRIVKELIESGELGNPVSGRFWVFSNVRAWHPYEDWRKLYAVRKSLGGGVLLTEIHEIDLINWFFGLPEAVFAAGGNWSGEEIDVEDTALMNLLYEDFAISINMAFLHHPPSRGFHICFTHGDIKWQEHDNILEITRGEKTSRTPLDDFIPESMFLNQARKYLFDWTSLDTNESLDSAADSLAVVCAAIESIDDQSVHPVISQ